MEPSPEEVEALVAYVASRGRVDKREVAAHFRWLPSRAVENLRWAVRRGLLRRVEMGDREGTVAYEMAPGRRG